MPGVVMDNASVSGSRLELDAANFNNGIPNSSDIAGKGSDSEDLKNGSSHTNGSLKERTRDTFSSTDERRPPAEALSNVLSQLPPELVHITQGFFPYAQLVNRSVQQCWNDLSDLISELAEIQVPAHSQLPQSSVVNSKSLGNQSAENIHKKMRILGFAQAKRAEFIKLLVLSQWSRQVADVSKLIDLQGFIRTWHQAYNAALQRVGDMKRDLVRAQVANPDLKTALEVLSKGKVAAMPDLGYKPPRPLTAKKMLKTLQKINRIISVRLVLHDSVPTIFRTYLVHDGRVTFFVEGEFEIDLSIAEQNHSSQFFFIDIRFVFSPSSPIPKGRFFNELDLKINDILRDGGLVGCLNFVHNLVLTNKINILFRQALVLARGSWSDALRIELLHRTLIVQYWALKPGARSWLEIGVKSGSQKDDVDGSQIPGVPYLGLRWMRDNKEVDNASIRFDKEVLSMESILRSVIALHTSHVLRSAYSRLAEGHLYSSCTFSLKVHVSEDEPGGCCLTVQLTRSRYLRVSVEPISGAVILSAIPTLLSRHEADRSTEKSPVDGIVSRVSRLRCIAAMEEVESYARILGWETINPRGLKLDIRRTFPSNILRFSFFSHPLWEPNWIAAATSSMDGDHWWILQLKTTPSAVTRSTLGGGFPVLQSAQIVTEKLADKIHQLDYASFANLEHSLAGMLAIHANARYLEELHCVHSFPPVQKLQLEPGLRVPNLFLCFDASRLPPGLQISCPPGVKKRRFLKDTICLSFQGIDSQAKYVIIVAYGQLLAPVRTIGSLTSELDRSVVFQPKGCGFAIRFLVAAGTPIIGSLFNRLQRLEYVLSILESLERKKIRTRSISFSRIAFSYGPEQDLYASICVKCSELSSENMDPATVRSKTTPPVHLRLGINFDRSNPHRRIKQSLTAILNNNDSGTGIDCVTELLTLTIPLLRALDRITSSNLHGRLSKVLVTARSAKVYQIYYPDHRFRFLIATYQHRDRMTWILTDAGTSQERSCRDGFEAKLRETLYNSKGDGWKGLGNGAVADFQKVGNLLAELDMCFASGQSEPGMKASDRNVNDDETGKRHLVDVGKVRNISTGDAKAVDVYGHAASMATSTNKIAQQKSELAKDADVITID